MRKPVNKATDWTHTEKAILDPRAINKLYGKQSYKYVKKKVKT